MWATVQERSAWTQGEDDVLLLAMNNTNQKYTSAAKAYNVALKLLKEAEVVVFCYQDIVFLEGSLDTVYKECISQPDVLFGAAGVKNVGYGSASEGTYYFINGYDD